MGRANVGGVQLAYDVAGQGRGVVWGHGLSSSRANEDAEPLVNWVDLGDIAKVLRYDARGHGQSDLSDEPAGYGWDALALDQLDLASQVGFDRYVAGGASMGCGTALHAALAAPERVEALVLVIPPTAWETRRERAGIWADVATSIERNGVEPFLASTSTLPEPNPFVGRPDRRARYEAHIRATEPRRLATVFRGAATADLPDRDAVATIRVPTLILAWSGDAAHPVSTAERLAELMPQAQMAVADTHDQLATWTARLRAFLAQL